MHGGGALIASVCTGSLLLAEAGLVDGRACAGHWAYAGLYRPRSTRRSTSTSSAILVLGSEPDRVITAGGVTAWQDLALHVIARLCGRDARHRDRQGAPPGGPRGRAAPVRRPGPADATCDDAVVARCQAWIAENYAVDNPVAAMVERSGLQSRTFGRRFRAATGERPIDYVHAVRIDEARQCPRVLGARRRRGGLRRRVRRPDVLPQAVQAPDRPDAGGLPPEVRKHPRLRTAHGGDRRHRQQVT